MLLHVNSLATVTSRVSTVLLLSAGSLVVYLHSIQSLKCLKSCGYSASTRCCQIRQSPGAPVRYRATPDQGLFINYFAHYLDKTLRRTTLYCTSNRVVATVVCPWHCRVWCSVVGIFCLRDSKTTPERSRRRRRTPQSVELGQARPGPGLPLANRFRQIQVQSDKLDLYLIF